MAAIIHRATHSAGVRRGRGVGLLGEDLYQVHQSLGRLLESTTRVEFDLAVKVVAAGEDVRARQAAERELRAIRAAPNGKHEGLDAGATRCLEGVARQLGMVREHV